MERTYAKKILGKLLSPEQTMIVEEKIKLESKENLEEYARLVTKVFSNLNSDYVKNKLSTGLWNPEDIVCLERETLAPEKWGALQDARLPKNIVKERVKGTNMCPKCKSWYTTYKQAQTRSGDEGLTTRCYCEDCEHHWKFG